MRSIVRLKHAIVMILFLGTIMSCNELLDVNETRDVTLEERIVGAYNVFGGNNAGELFGGDLVIIHDLLSYPPQQAILSDQGALAEFFSKEITNLNQKVEANWNAAYQVINICNEILALDNIDDFPQVKGEALAIRAIIYFELVKLWGANYNESTITTSLSVPLILKPTVTKTDNQKPERATTAVVLNRIETDLSSAFTLLSSVSLGKERLGANAVAAYQMRVALMKGDYSEAKDFADIVLAGNYNLTDNAISAFNNESATSEDIFVVAQTLENNAGDKASGNGLPAFYSSLNASGNGVFIGLKSSIASVFGLAEGDSRFSTDLTTTASETAETVNTFYYKPPTVTIEDRLSVGKYESNTNVISVIRAAEVYLSRAEASAELDVPSVSESAIMDLNAIRSRAGLDSVQSSDFANGLVLIDSIRLERRRELAFEGHLLTDSRRWGRTIGFIEPTDASLILPIPASETRASGLE